MPAKLPEKVYVIGVGMTKFEKPGRREGWDYPDMARESGTMALNDAGVDYQEVEQGFVGYVAGDSTCGQRALYELVLASQEAAIAATRAGARFNAPHEATVAVLAFRPPPFACVTRLVEPVPASFGVAPVTWNSYGKRVLAGCD